MRSPRKQVVIFEAIVADLVLARTCAGCQVLGTVLCPPCWASMCANPGPHELRGRVPSRPVLPIAVGSPYSGAAKACIIAHKEHGVRSLTTPLGVLLALAIATLDPGPAPLSPLVLITIPAHGSSLRARGADTVAMIARQAAIILCAAGQPSTVHLGLRRQTDQGRHVGRSAHERQAAIIGSFATIPSSRLRACGDRFVVVDDVITTGATVFEAVRALTDDGLAVSGIAAVAGTPLHRMASLSQFG